MSAGVERVAHDARVFKPDPDYGNIPYDPQRQIEIYGGKRDIEEPRPLLELGRPMYREGPLPPSSGLFGAKNPASPSLTVYGDWRLGLAANGKGADRVSEIATRLNLEVDLAITSTERLHALFRPLDRDGRFTRHAFSGPGPRREFLLDGQVDTLFFEGDLGQMAAGFTDRYNRLDVPVAAGLMPLTFHSGVWMDDAIAGVALARAGRHSRGLGISNMDISVFAGLGKVSSPALRDAAGGLAESGARVLGAALFLDASEGYWELGLGRVFARGALAGQGYNSAAVSFTRRYGGWLSNSVRLVGAFGQAGGHRRQNGAGGAVLLLENSLVTSRPLSLVPYFNLFAGFGRPQSLARDPEAGGLLKNTGILFESDGLTRFPRLDDSAHDTYGAAIGIQHLFDLDRQIVFEIAGLDVRRGARGPGLAVQGAQVGIGLRYQQPLTKSLIFRADAIAARLSNATNLLEIRSELRLKF